jgi:hypothetical protein
MKSTIRVTLSAWAIVFAVGGIPFISTGPAFSQAVQKNEALPFATTSYVLGDKIDAYARFMMSGGPPPDGIPSIDQPRFVSAAEAGLDPGDLVIGIHRDGEARAYPQRILVYHEIVNDRIGGLNVAVTYCPLTATAQGFKRGDATLGVSGQLINSNLVMFDRSTRSHFSQINATGITGPHRGRTLDEIRLVWTTWARWRSVHPETRVLSDRTGHLRNYTRDPYGSYNPLGGYYAQNATMFPLMHESNRHGTKTMVLGARTATRSAFFVMADLAKARVQSTDNFLAVYDPRLDTGYIYVRDGKKALPVARDDGRYEYAGALHAADALPLRQAVAVAAFHFAWHAFYPRSESP